MKILGFSASPRKQGNTAWIVRTILNGAKEQGISTEFYTSSELNINPCQGCLGCIKGGKGCVTNDGMQIIYSALNSSDALVLGSPVYMGQMAAQAKIFLDRLYAISNAKFLPEREKKIKLILSFTQAHPDRDIFKDYFDYTKKRFEMLKFDVMDVNVVANMIAAAAPETENLEAELKNLGKELAL